MILWTRSGAEVVPIFRALDGTSATMRLDGQTTPLTLQSQSGDLKLGMRANQLYVSENDTGSTTVEAKLQWGQSFPAGTYVQRGALTVSGADGWSRIVPVAGIAGCKR
jgi:hypothetical protein